MKRPACHRSFLLNLNCSMVSLLVRHLAGALVQILNPPGATLHFRIQRFNTFHCGARQALAAIGGLGGFCRLVSRVIGVFAHLNG